MEEAIKKIIEIENGAQSLISEGYAKAEKIYMDSLEELKNMEANIGEMANFKIDELREKSRAEADEKLKKINESQERKIHILEDYVENYRETWEDQIFNRILGR